MFFPISSWLPAFAATLAIEAPVVILALHRASRSLAALTVVVLFANLATHLGIWFVATQLLDPGTLPFAVIAETWAVAGEALLFWAAIAGVTPGRAFLTAVAANAASFLLGLVIGSAWPGLIG